ncbi:2275_t:CDS:2 [Entrophospora sp. SA101]|nr:2275_t:CDS:2 [Entrophospora sp. SA101]
MVMLCMRPADVRNLHIDQYNSNNAEWYDPKYSWYCTGYAKNKNDEPRPLRITYLDPKINSPKFPFLIKDKDGDVNVHPINNFLIPYGISSSLLRKIGSDHAIIIHEGKTRSKCNRLCKLALRHKINREASDHYGIMYNRPNTPAPKQENSIVNSCPNIIHLDLDYTAGFGYKALIMVAKSYPNLKYLNLRKAGLITDESLCVIAKLCNKLEYLNISNCVEITKKSLFEVARSCQNLEELYFAEGDGITDKSISYIINQCSKLRCLDIAYSGVEIEDSSMMIQKRLNIEYLDFANLMGPRNDNLILAIIRSSPNLKHFDISGNNIEDEPPPLIRGLIQHDDLNPPDHFITEFNNYLRQ